MNDKNTNEIRFDMSRLDKWLKEGENIEIDNENKGKVLIDFGFHKNTSPTNIIMNFKKLKREYEDNCKLEYTTEE